MKLSFWDHRDQHAAEQRRLSAKLEREGLDFEKWLITLATGTLVLSVTLIGTATIARGNTLALVASWVALVVSVCAGLFDRLLFIFSLSAHPELLDDHAEQEEKVARERRWLNYWAWSERASWLQIVTFFLGILALLFFAISQI